MPCVSKSAVDVYNPTLNGLVVGRMGIWPTSTKCASSRVSKGCGRGPTWEGLPVATHRWPIRGIGPRVISGKRFSMRRRRLDSKVILSARVAAIGDIGTLGAVMSWICRMK
jgi:hypothetical protein